MITIDCFVCQNNYGILSMLDEECLRPNLVSDEIFLHQITKSCQENSYYKCQETFGCRNFNQPSCSAIKSNTFIGNLIPNLISLSSLSSFKVRHFTGSVSVFFYLPLHLLSLILLFLS